MSIPVGANKTPLPPITVGTRLANRKSADSRKVVMVTGGASGIGARFATKAAAEGANVVLADLPGQAEKAKSVMASIEKLGNGAKSMFVPLDVANEESWIAAMDAVEKELGPISVLVNGAGVTGAPAVDIENLEFKNWSRTMSINSDGVMLGCKHGARSMLKLPADWDKSIVNISSILGLVGSDKSFAYCASKAAVRNLTKAVALNLASRGTGIRVNSVHPGYVESEMTDTWLDEERYKMISAWHAVNRFATADEIANMILFLASEDSTFCVGAEYTVDGGYTAR